MGGPEKVEVETGGEWLVQDSFPPEETVTWYMPARGSMPPVRVRYFMMGADALEKKVLPLLHDLPPGSSLKTLFRFGRGAAIIGEKATIIYGGWGAEGRIVPDAKAKEIGLAPEKSHVKERASRSRALITPGRWRRWCCWAMWPCGLKASQSILTSRPGG
jgi:hypothetical protein